MEFYRQAKRSCLVEDRAKLVRRKGDALAEGIDRIDQTFAVGNLQAGDRHFFDIGGVAALVFRRCCVGGKPGGLDPDGTKRGKASRCPQHLQLGLDIEAIAGLDLDGGDAFGHQGVEARQRGLDQLILAQRIRGRYGRDNAASGARDFLVGRALQPHLEFLRAAAAIDEMGMAVDQRRGYQPSAAIDLFETGAAFRQTSLGTGMDDAAILYGKHAFDNVRAANHGRDTGVDEKFGRS